MASFVRAFVAGEGAVKVERLSEPNDLDGDERRLRMRHEAMVFVAQPASSRRFAQ
jgi:hypothetical protein